MTPIADLTFEQAMAELEGIVRTLESGQTPLQDSIAAYERGMALRKHCEELLVAARLKVETVVVAPDAPMDVVGTKPF